MSSIDPEIRRVLDMRLAQGELDIEQYQSLLKTMAQDRGNHGSVQGKIAPLPALHLGSLRHAWKKISSPSWTCRLHRRYQTTPDVKNRLLWLDNVLDYLITDEYLIILSSSPDTKVKRITETVASVGVVAGALGGGLFVALPAVLVGTAYENLFGTTNKFDPEALAAIFNSGYAIYAKKSDLAFLSFSIKPSSFEFAYATVAIFGNFKNATLGDVDLCFLLSEKQGLNPNIAVLKPLKAAGCLVTENAKSLTSPDQVDDYLLDFPDPAHIYQTEIVWCLNCRHYQERKGWNKGISFFSMKGTGDHTLKLKPPNDKLPCQIPTEACSTWDHFYSLSKDSRALYPRDCSLFERT